jgi:hypothetical protein
LLVYLPTITIHLNILLNYYTVIYGVVTLLLLLVVLHEISLKELVSNVKYQKLRT